ncbi:histidine phosphatase family protein [Solidesulfovibrio sp.]
MSTLFLLRHGAIAQYEPRRFIGQTDHPLTEEGRRQAELWREALAGVPFEAVAVSDLCRCRETAAIILRGREGDIRCDPRLREIALGEFEGLTVDDVQARFPGAYERRGCDIAGFRPVGGESFADVQTRAVAAVSELAHLCGNVLVVAHGGVNRAILCHALGLDLAHLFRLGQDYCRLNLLDLEPDCWRVTGVNLAPGLPWQFPGP